MYSVFVTCLSRLLKEWQGMKPAPAIRYCKEEKSVSTTFLPTSSSFRCNVWSQCQIPNIEGAHCAYGSHVIRGNGRNKNSAKTYSIRWDSFQFHFSCWHVPREPKPNTMQIFFNTDIVLFFKIQKVIRDTCYASLPTVPTSSYSLQQNLQTSYQPRTTSSSHGQNFAQSRQPHPAFEKA